MTQVEFIHASGRFDATAVQFDRWVKKTRDVAEHGIITRTELTSKRLHDRLIMNSVPSHAVDTDMEKKGWVVFHPMTEFGLANCAVEWDRMTWRLERTDIHITSPRRVKTPKGFELPPGIEIIVRLEHRATGKIVRAGGMHMMLHNTKERTDIWYDQAHALRQKFRSNIKKDHRVTLIEGVDVNWTQRLKMNRERVGNHLLPARNGRMKNVWDHTPIPPYGTHDKAILDTVLTTGKIEKVIILPKFAGFDHRPLYTLLDI